MENQLQAIADALQIDAPSVTPENTAGLPDLKGAYVLLLRLAEPVLIDLPRQPEFEAAPGWYFYAGSARGGGGIRARVTRHFRPDKRVHWHIDRLSLKAPEMAAIAVENGNECDLAGRLLE
jgi:Uri superfamily endonuclease